MSKNVIIITLALIIAVGFGFFIGNSNDTNQNQLVNQTETENESSENKDAGVNALVTYSLPDGWKEESCDSNPGSVYVIPAGAGDVDCGANPSSPIKLSVDPGDTKDCNELQNVSEVKKHVCISLYVNDMLSLKATTEYLASSPYGKETTINAYYINTGNGVIKAEYIYNTDNNYQVGFDQLVNSIKAK